MLIDGAPVNQPGGAIDFSNFTLEAWTKSKSCTARPARFTVPTRWMAWCRFFTHRGTTTTPQLMLEGDGGTFGTGHGSAQLSGLLGAFDYSAAAGYFATEGQGPDDYFRDATASRKFRLEILGYGFAASHAAQYLQRRGPAGTRHCSLPPSARRKHNDLHDFRRQLDLGFATGRALAAPS